MTRIFWWCPNYALWRSPYTLRWDARKKEWKGNLESWQIYYFPTREFGSKDIVPQFWLCSHHRPNDFENFKTDVFSFSVAIQPDKVIKMQITAYYGRQNSPKYDCVNPWSFTFQVTDNFFLDYLSFMNFAIKTPKATHFTRIPSNGTDVQSAAPIFIQWNSLCNYTKFLKRIRTPFCQHFWRWVLWTGPQDWRGPRSWTHRESQY